MSNRKKTREQRLQQTVKNNKYSYHKEKAKQELAQIELQKTSTQLDAILQKG